MKNIYKLALIILLFIGLNISNTFAINTLINSLVLSGQVFDQDTREILIGATIYVEEFKTGTATDINGNYQIRLPYGTYSLTISFIGYETQQVKVTMANAMKRNFYLKKSSQQIADVLVTDERSDINITRTEMGVEKMKIQTIRKIPALMGEVDIIKAIQLLPGVQSTSEGSSGFSVRGGNYDQNLILLDNAPIYNASHFVGFFSVFNNDAIKEISLYKGDIPVSHGGRLSSLLDIEVAEGNTEKWKGSAGLGTISTRFMANGPLGNDKTTLFLAGRFFNAQLYLLAMQNFEEDLKGVRLYFYDLNGKLSHKFNRRNTLTANFYKGSDVFNQKEFEFGFGNTAASLSWLHAYNENVVSRFSLIHSKYGYKNTFKFDATSGMIWDSDITDYGFRVDNTIILDAQNTIKFGASSLYHSFYPGKISPTGSESIFNAYKLAENSALEWGIYGSNEQKVGSKLTLRYGLRFSIFQNVGSGTIYSYDNDYQVTDTSNYQSGDVYNVYQGLEPRFGVVYQLNETSSLKASYSRTRQYIHMASNSAGGSQFDIWIASNPNIKPQTADQFAVGYFRNFWFNQLESSIELYYKKMQNTIDFKDHAQLFLNRQIDGELRIGSAYAYGAEFQVKYNFEKLNGWVSYTLSKSMRDIPEINNGEEYRSPYDKPHDISIIANYQLTPKWSLSANWVYATGAPMTLPSGFYESNGVVQAYYAEGTRNDSRMPDYHRLDLGVTYKNKPVKSKRLTHEWNFSVYNAYARKNPWTINPVRDEQTGEIKFEMIYLFSIVPSITYNVNF